MIPGSSHLPRISMSTSKGILLRRERNTEITNKESLRSVGRPFPIGNVVVAIDIESELLFALQTSVSGMQPLWSIRTLLNFSNPPSDSSIVLIHCSALAYRCRSASLNGESQGSSWTTPGTISYLQLHWESKAYQSRHLGFHWQVFHF